MTMNLFRNKTIKLSVMRENDVEVMALWQEDSEYVR
ncbi:N-acetyltransferase, partial [Bacillus thuringiensis]|nr:N-acetyltransferase [Bacillus thuringiensis]